jgi:hypothetical protein
MTIHHHCHRHWKATNTAVSRTSLSTYHEDAAELNYLVPFTPPNQIQEFIFSNQVDIRKENEDALCDKRENTDYIKGTVPRKSVRVFDLGCEIQFKIFWSTLHVA